MVAFRDALSEALISKALSPWAEAARGAASKAADRVKVRKAKRVMKYPLFEYNVRFAAQSVAA
jgi:hypothetical protein